MTRVQVPSKARVSGFTLIELIVVIGIIGVTAAVSLPNIRGYLLASRIRTAQDLVAGAISRARYLAIMRNTQLGVSFVVQSNKRFWVHVEDVVQGTTADVGYTRRPLDVNVTNALLSSMYDLPTDVEFAASPADCPLVAGFAPANFGLRFDRYGLSTVPPVAPDTIPIQVTGAVPTNRIYAPATGSRAVCLIDRRTGLRRALLIAPGGRVNIVQ